MANIEKFSQKVVLVTGSSSGIGAATAVHLSGLGAQVVITGRSADRLHAVSIQCQQNSTQGLKPLQVIADLDDENDSKLLIDTTIKSFGRLDVLVNNAAEFNCNSNIQNQDSIHTYDKFANALAHSMAKSAIDMFTRSLAYELGPQGVRVNSINPAQMKTPVYENFGMSKEEVEKMWSEVSKQYPLRRPGEPEDVAKAVAYLASDDSSFATGVSLKLDGGFMDSLQFIFS
ncbi:unnamed protein product [Oppiella nova]|uniref:Short-chain dehydrogenase n=1 Tax=Oppiella nova TaxID=334625 RepID=A0A7R9LD22_9ACAR|nr:unnamed protein product [Oppiella nova]CAG2162388.1 unnamed protein product [Oppiella nova]